MLFSCELWASQRKDHEQIASAQAEILGLGSWIVGINVHATLQHPKSVSNARRAGVKYLFGLVSSSDFLETAGKHGEGPAALRLRAMDHPSPTGRWSAGRIHSQKSTNPGGFLTSSLENFISSNENVYDILKCAPVVTMYHVKLLCFMVSCMIPAFPSFGVFQRTSLSERDTRTRTLTTLSLSLSPLLSLSFSLSLASSLSLSLSLSPLFSLSLSLSLG